MEDVAINIPAAAGLGFETWDQPSDNDFISPAKWKDLGERDIPFINVARVIHSRTKPELMEMFRTEPDISMRLADDLKSSGEDYHALARMLEGGHARLLVAAAALVQEEQPDAIHVEVVAPETAGDDDAASCPMAALIDKYDEAVRQRDTLTDAEADAYWEKHGVPVERELLHDTPRVHSIKGAAGALRLVLSYEEIDPEDANLIRAALTYLEGEA